MARDVADVAGDEGAAADPLHGEEGAAVGPPAVDGTAVAVARPAGRP
jgi:hypothetical protein